MAPGGAGGGKKRGGKKKKKKAVVKGEQANEAGAPTSATSGNSTAAGGDDAAGAEGNTAAATEISEPLVGDGQKLIEIFQVCVQNCGGRKLSSVYGEVSLRTGYGQLKIFSQPKERPEPLGPFGGSLTLVGPEYAMTGYDSLELCLDLWEGEEQVISGYADLEARNDAQYNCPLCEVIEGSKGKAVVLYAVFFTALVANVEMKFIKGGEEGKSEGSSEISPGEDKVFGSIYASNSMTFASAKSVLFKRTKDECACVGDDGIIPLMRPVIAVPTNTHLLFCAKLSVLSSYHESCELKVREDHGIDVATISGELGRIEVTITWESLWEHYLRTMKN